MRYDPSFNPAVTYYYQQDHEGSVTHLLNTSGNVIEITSTMPSARRSSMTLTTLSVRPLPTATGSCLPEENTRTCSASTNIARAPTSTLGRFMSEDPKLFDAGDYNLFRYCYNNPVNLTDPMGLDAISNGDGTYHFVLRSDIIVPNIIGGYVIKKSDGTARQCAGAAQFLTGTRTADGTLHEAPLARNGGWTQGAPLTKETPNGTMVARRWENGVYPNKGIEQYRCQSRRERSINHQPYRGQDWLE